MYLPECLVWAMIDGCTAVKIFCAEDLRANVASRFTEVFSEEYDKVMDLVEEEEGECYEKEEDINPFGGARIADYGVYLPFDSLALFGEWGNHLAAHDAGEAIEKALKKIKKEFSSIRYEGYVAYSWSDLRRGGVCQYEITSDKKKKASEDTIYDFVGKALAEIFQDKMEWDRLVEELKCAKENDFKNTLKVLYMYSQWIPTDAIDRIIDLAVDEELKCRLECFVKDLKNGNDAEIKEDEIDFSGLPDGYMEALEMFMKAEEVNEITSKRGEVISSEGTFDIVIEQAEAGDAEAKFIAGKYFIADHVDGEYDRAIQWIREAADADIEEAEDYIKEHSELFK